jgi:hypothetical protein
LLLQDLHKSPPFHHHHYKQYQRAQSRPPGRERWKKRYPYIQFGYRQQGTQRCGEQGRHAKVPHGLPRAVQICQLSGPRNDEHAGQQQTGQ